MSTTLRLDGDSMLAPMDIKFWSLHQHVLIQFGVYTYFKWYPGDVPNGTRGLIQWFVPEQATNAAEVAEWVRHELEPEYSEDRPSVHGLPMFPGTDVEVMVALFSGPRAYVERDVLEPMLAEMTERLLNKVKAQQ